MLIALFGKIERDVVAKFTNTDHVLLLTDHPAEASTLAHVIEAGIRHVVCRAEWRNLNHPRSRVEQRVNRDTFEVEDYNANGGFVRDCLMVGRSDAVILGSNIRPDRDKLIRDEAVDRPIHVVAPVVERVPPKQAAAELKKIFK